MISDAMTLMWRHYKGWFISHRHVIEAQTRCPPFCRLHFQTYFVNDSGTKFHSNILRLVQLTMRQHWLGLWASYQIHKIAGCACAGNTGNVFPATAGYRSRHASRHVRHTRWPGKRSRHSRRTRNPQFYLSGKRPMVQIQVRIISQTNAY